jgi:hypothetical protein
MVPRARQVLAKNGRSHEEAHRSGCPAPACAHRWRLQRVAALQQPTALRPCRADAGRRGHAPHSCGSDAVSGSRHPDPGGDAAAGRLLRGCSSAVQAGRHPAGATSQHGSTAGGANDGGRQQHHRRQCAAACAVRGGSTAPTRGLRASAGGPPASARGLRAPASRARASPGAMRSWARCAPASCRPAQPAACAPGRDQQSASTPGRGGEQPTATGASGRGGEQPTAATGASGRGGEQPTATGASGGGEQSAAAASHSIGGGRRPRSTQTAGHPCCSGEATQAAERRCRGGHAFAGCETSGSCAWTPSPRAPGARPSLCPRRSDVPASRFTAMMEAPGLPVARTCRSDDPAAQADRNRTRPPGKVS